MVTFLSSSRSLIAINLESLTLFLQWLMDGAPLPPSLPNIHISSAGFSSSLSISSLVSGHHGWYSCSCSNPGGQTSTSALLSVHTPPRWLETPASSLSLVPGTRLQLGCRAGGRPAPRLQWWRRGEGGEWVTLGQARPENGSLILEAVTEDDEGEYRCTATSPLGSRLSCPVTLDVQVAPSFPGPGRQVLARVGGRAVLACEGRGDGPMAWRWWREGEVLERQESSRLVVRRARIADSGSYTCQATNDYGSANCTITLAVQVTIPSISHHTPPPPGPALPGTLPGDLRLLLPHS